MSYELEQESKGGRRPDTPGERLEIDARAELIQALIPIGLEAVNDLLQQEVVSLVGARYSRGPGDYARWGRQQGSVYLGDHKLAMTVPRVRDLRRGRAVPLAAYQALGRPRRAEEAALLKLLKGLSCRDYEACVEPAAETFGLTASSLSRRFKRASAKKPGSFEGVTSNSSRCCSARRRIRNGLRKPFVHARESVRFAWKSTTERDDSGLLQGRREPQNVSKHVKMRHIAKAQNHAEILETQAFQAFRSRPGCASQAGQPAFGRFR